MRSSAKVLVGVVVLATVAAGFAPLPGLEVEPSSAGTTVFSDKSAFRAATLVTNVPFPSSDNCGLSLSFDGVVVTAPNAVPSNSGCPRRWGLVYDAPPYFLASPPNPNPNQPIIAANGEDDYLLTFDQPVAAVGLGLVTNFSAQETLTARDEAGNVVLSVSVDPLTTANSRAFVGVTSSTRIKTLLFDTVGGGSQNEVITEILLGGVTRPPEELFGFRLNNDYVADPVNTATGNLTEMATDLAFAGGDAGLNLDRTYNSRSNAAGVLGRGWTLNFERRLTPQPSGAVRFDDGDGRVVTFPPDGTGYASPEEVFATLAAGPGGGWSLGYYDGRADIYDAAGHLVEQRQADGTAVFLSWPGGVLSNLTSSAGGSLTMGYSPASGNLETATADDGRQVTYQYTTGFLSSVTLPGGAQTTYELDAAGRVTAITDPSGVVQITNEYDGKGRVASQTDAALSVTAFAYNDLSGVTTVIHQASGSEVSYSHDGAGRVTGARDPYGATISRSYDDAGNLAATVDRRGTARNATYDAHGNPTSFTDPGSGPTSVDYDGSDRPVSVTEASGAVTTAEYAGADRVPSIITSAGAGTVSQTVVDGLVTSVVDGDGVVTDYSYDSRRRLVGVTDGLGHTTVYGYDSAGRQTTVTTPLGNTTASAYDGAGRLSSTTDPSGATTTYTYDPAGRLLSTTDPIGAVTSNTYDGAGRLATTISPGGASSTYTYDELGRLTRLDSPAPAGQATSLFAYGPLGRLESETNPTGATTSHEYDVDGAEVLTDRPATGPTTTAYDGAGRIVSVTDVFGKATTSVYDGLGRLATVTAPGGAVTSYIYDQAGRASDVTDARGGRTLTTWTPGGRLSTVADPAGGLTTYGYDEAGRQVTVLGPGAGAAVPTTSTYDDDGRVIAVTSPSGLVSRASYDRAGRVLTETGPSGRVTTRTWSLRGELLSVLHPGGARESFAYDAAGHLARVTDPNGSTTTYTYDLAGNRTARRDAMGSEETWAYDDAGRVTSRRDQLGRDTTTTYDGAGRVATLADASGRSTTATYDAGGRVTARTYADGTSVGYAYDAAGRRTSMTDATGTTTWSWSAAGDLLSSRRPDGAVTSFAYDAAGRRTSMTYPDGTAVGYSYDGSGGLASVTPLQAAADTWTGPGSTWDPAKWSLATSSSVADVVDGTGRLKVKNVASAQVTATSAAPPAADAELVFSYAFGDNAGGAVLRARLRSTPGGAYALEVPNDSATVALVKEQGGGTTTLGTATFRSDTARHWARLRVEGSTLSVKLWTAGETEPTSWTAEVVDPAIAGAGKAAVALSRAAGTHEARVDDLVLKDLAGPPPAVSTYTYDADGRLSANGIPGGSRSWGYAGGELTTFEQSLPSGVTRTTLGRDAAGRVSTETTGGSTTAYTYDAGGQLKKVKPPSGAATTYTYDALGRRATMAKGTAVTTFAYDAAGQLLTTTAPAGATTHAYDGAGRLVSSSGAAIASYDYDGAGRLVAVGDGLGTQARVLNGDGDPVAITTKAPGGSPLATMVVGDPVSGALTALHRSGVATDVLAGVAWCGTRATALALDARASATGGGCGNALAAAGAYDAFGQPKSKPRLVPSIGYRSETTNGRLVDLHARMYDPASGRFLTTDPEDGVDGSTTVAYRYHYADNDPINRSDPTGRFSIGDADFDGGLWRSGGGGPSGLDLSLGGGGPSGLGLSPCGLSLTGPSITCLRGPQPGPRPRPPGAPPQPAPPGPEPAPPGGGGGGRPGGLIKLGLALAALAAAGGPNPSTRQDPGCQALNTTPPFSGGPGVWTFMLRGTSGEAYASRVTGAPPGCEYRLNGYYFDGFQKPGYGRPAVLIEAKSGTGQPRNGDGSFMFANPHQPQVANQVGAALPTSLPIAWVFENHDHKRAFDLAIQGTFAALVIFTKHVP